MQRSRRIIRIKNQNKAKIILRVKKLSRLFFSVIFLNAKIKLNARAALLASHKKSVPAVAAILFLLFLFSLFNGFLNIFKPFENFLPLLSLLSLAMSVLIISPLRLRLEKNLILTSCGFYNSKHEKNELIRAIKSAGLTLCLFSLKLLWLAVYEAVPLCGALFLSFRLSKEAVSLRAFWIFLLGITVLTLFGFAFWLVFIQRYSKSMFFFACYKDFSCADAIKESVKRTRGQLLKILIFKLGFLPWFVLCAAGLPALFVIPYYKQSLVCFYLKK